MEERRKHDRVYNITIDAKIYLGSGDNEGIICKIRDLSPVSMFFEYPEDIKVNKVVQVTLDPSSINIDFSTRISAIVIRTEKLTQGYNVAVMFTNVSKEDCRLLKKIVAHYEAIKE